jgi:hypothetical protein
MRLCFANYKAEAHLNVKNKPRVGKIMTGGRSVIDLPYDNCEIVQISNKGWRKTLSLI